MHKEKGPRPHDGKVKNLRNAYAKNRTDIVQDSVALIREQNDDRIQQTKQGEWGEKAEEFLFEIMSTGGSNNTVASCHPCDKGDPQVLIIMSLRIQVKHSQQLTIRTDIATLPYSTLSLFA